MKKVLVVSFCLLFALSSIALAKQAPKGTNPQLYKDLDRPLDEQGVFAAAQADTYYLAYYTFDDFPVCTREGWTSHDLTAQAKCYWHVDDFAGMPAPYAPLEGNQSLWCGARPHQSQEPECTFATLPGYGNGWAQGWCMRCIEVPDTESVALSYLIQWDTEPNYDFTYVQYATKGSCDSLADINELSPSDWITLATYDDVGAKQLATHTIPAGHADAIRIRFQVESDGAWSDEDGIRSSDGASIFDSVTVAASVGGLIDYEDFEYDVGEGGENVGDQATADGDWECCLPDGFGDYAGLFPGLTVLQEDPCYTNMTCVWGFFNGSTADYDCGGHPEQLAVPYENQAGQVINNEIWSPWFSWDYDMWGSPATGTVAWIEFDIYRDLDLYSSCVFYTWHIRSKEDNLCPGNWGTWSYVYYGSNKDWIRQDEDVGQLIKPGADSVQIALGVIDMTPYWHIRYCINDCHSHAPLFDNVEMYRIGAVGPQWSSRWIDMFQDTWATNGEQDGTGRCDMAQDIYPNDDVANVQAGDSVRIQCADPESGLMSPDPYTATGSAVYLYMYRDPETKPMPLDKIVEDGVRWPLVDSVNCDGHTWYQFRMDTTFADQTGLREDPVPDTWCVDINDHFFVNGDTIWYFFGAANTLDQRTYYSAYSGTEVLMEEACSVPHEMQILPGAGYYRGGDILYVNYFANRGAAPYFNSAFQMMGIYDQVDRFDKLGPSSMVCNGIAYCCKSVENQLIPKYRKLIWNSGNLSAGTVGDGTGQPEKNDDFGVLYTFLTEHTHPLGAGVYFSGDDMAEEWENLPGGQIFIDTYIPHYLLYADHNELHGIVPNGIGMPGGHNIFVDLYPDTFCVFGGCPVINDFDVIQPFPPSTLEMAYDGEPDNPAVIAAATLNPDSIPVKIVLSGFSYHYIRDDRPYNFLDRVQHLTEIIQWLGNILPYPVAVDPTPQFANRLDQNYPNPFNPSTTIKYSIKERAHVTLKVYNVAGQLVKTLVDEQQVPRSDGFTVRWNGRSNSGNPVSSGVYFYRLVTKNFTQTKKMVLLK